MREGDATQTSRKGFAPMSDPGSTTVLVVDDDPEIRTLLVDALIEVGYVVHSAIDGVAGIRSFVVERPDLVLLDIDMPRLRGTETLLVMHELAPQTRVIMISGKADESEARRTLALGAFDYISKPFDLAYLYRVIETAV
jgi:DNA-binding response OmpR family regulator